MALHQIQKVRILSQNISFCVKPNMKYKANIGVKLYTITFCFGVESLYICYIGSHAKFRKSRSTFQNIPLFHPATPTVQLRLDRWTKPRVIICHKQLKHRCGISLGE